jgi:hypothetical protein
MIKSNWYYKAFWDQSVVVYRIRISKDRVTVKREVESYRFYLTSINQFVNIESVNVSDGPLSYSLNKIGL